MKVTQVVEAGEVKTFYMPSWSDSQVELYTEDGEIKISLPENIMKSMHKEFGEKLAAFGLVKSSPSLRKNA